MKKKILYSFCWEDPKILTIGLQITSKDTVLSITSGGENIFALLLEKPKKLVAIDENHQQIYLAKLKAIAIKELSFQEFVQFLGYKPAPNRLNQYKKLAKHLSKKEREFWDNNQSYIKNGLASAGKFETYLKYFRSYVLSLVLSKKDIRKYLTLKNERDQKTFYKQYWDNKLWRFLFKIFFSKTLMQALGRKRDYFRHNKKLDVAEHFYRRASYGITEVPAKSNYFMHMILTGSIPTPFKDHPYLDKNNFLKLKKLLDRVEFVHSELLEYLTQHKKNTISKYNLSDIFEATTQEEYENIMAHIAKTSPSKSRICYWNNLVKRNTHAKNIPVKPMNTLSRKLLAEDRVFFYSDFIVEETT